MNAARLAVEILLWFAVAVAWLSCIGLLVMDHVFDKLHYLAPVTTVSTSSGAKYTTPPLSLRRE